MRIANLTTYFNSILSEVKVWTFEINQMLGSESFTVVARAHEQEGTWEFSYESNVLVSPLLLSAKSLKNFDYIHYGLSTPPPIIVPTTQPALIDRQNIIHGSLSPSQNFGVRRQKQPLRWLSTSLQWEDWPAQTTCKIWPKSKLFPYWLQCNSSTDIKECNHNWTVL